jgi:hypothetical protein
MQYFEVEYQIVDVPYQDGIWVTTQACCQDITAQELLSRVVKSQNLIAYTRGQAVELWRYDEFFKPVSAGFLDLTGRTNGITPKLTREQPVAYEFKHKRDSDDKIMASYGGDWADGRIEVQGGVMEEEKVEVGYAATTRTLAPWIEVNWRGGPPATKYRVQKKTGDDWDDLAEILETGQGSYTYRLAPTLGATLYLRVISDYGEWPITVAPVTAYGPQDPPPLDVWYDTDTNEVVIEELR